MKKIIFAVCAVCALPALATLANAAGSSSPDETLRCVRRIVERKRLDASTLKQAASMLDRIDDDTLSECRALKKASSHLKKLTASQADELLDQMGRNGEFQSYESYRVIKDRFLMPWFLQCSIKGIEVEAALALRLGFGLSAGTCISDNGRVFTVLAPNVNLGYGLYFGIHATNSEFQIIRGQPSVQSEPDLVVGILVALRFAGTEGIEGRPVGMGIGIGAGEGDSYTLPIRLIPAGNDFTDILKTLRRG